MRGIIAIVWFGTLIVWAFFDWKAALTAFIVVGVGGWVVLTLLDALRGLTGLFRRPNVNVHVDHVDAHLAMMQKHADPTRPDEDEHPLIVIPTYRRGLRKGK